MLQLMILLNAGVLQYTEKKKVTLGKATHIDSDTKDTVYGQS